MTERLRKDFFDNTEIGYEILCEAAKRSVDADDLSRNLQERFSEWFIDDAMESNAADLLLQMVIDEVDWNELAENYAKDFGLDEERDRDE